MKAACAQHPTTLLHTIFQWQYHSIFIFCRGTVLIQILSMVWICKQWSYLNSHIRISFSVYGKKVHILLIKVRVKSRPSSLPLSWEAFNGIFTKSFFITYDVKKRKQFTWIFVLNDVFCNFHWPKIDTSCYNI